MNKKFLCSVILGLVLIAVFSSVVAAAEESILDRILGGGGDKNILERIVSSLFGEEKSQDILAGDWFARVLLFVLVFLVIYAIAEELPFIGAGKSFWLRGGISVVIALLATMWLKSEEINTILLSHQALGLVITGIIPFFAILAISRKLNAGETRHPFASKVLWVVFAIVLAFKWASAKPSEIGAFGQTVYPVLIVVVLIMLIIEKRVWIWATGIKLKDIAVEAKNVRREDLLAEVNELKRRIDELGSENAPDLVKRHNAKVKTLREHYGIRSIKRY